MTAPDHMLTVAQTAERLAVSPDTVRRWIAAGTLAVFRKGRTVRLDDGCVQGVTEVPNPVGGGHLLAPPATPVDRAVAKLQMNSSSIAAPPSNPSGQGGEAK